MNKELVVMIGLPALKGTLEYDGKSIDEISSQVVKEAKTLYDAGIRNMMIQNIGDYPMVQKVGPEIIAMMSRVTADIRRELPDDVSLGISVLMNEGAGALAIADANECDYIRAKIYVGAMVAASGIEYSCMDEVLNLKNKLSSKVSIWADIHDRTGTPLGNPSLVDACAQAIQKGKAEVLIITGKNEEESKEMIQEVKKAFPSQKVYLGGGVNPKNINSFLSLCDGVIVGSYLKKEGKMNEELDSVRLEEFMHAWKNQ